MTRLDLVPHVNNLQMLAKGSLKQKIVKAVKLWVILESIYGEDSILFEGTKIALNAWSDKFFSDKKYHPRDIKPSLLERGKLHDPKNTNSLSSNSHLEKENAIEQIDLLEIANNYDRVINGIKRFSLYLDYISRKVKLNIR